jgi:hypothetical protein
MVGPTRSISLGYSYLVQSNDVIPFEELETALLSSVADRTLDCSSEESHGEARVVALEMRYYESFVSDNFCNSELLVCNVVNRMMTLVIQGDYTQDGNDILSKANIAIEDSIGQLSSAFKGLTASFINDRPTVVKVQGLTVPLTNDETQGGKLSVFMSCFVVISAVGSAILFAILYIHRSAKRDKCLCKTGDLEVPTLITISQSLEDESPSERCQDISPINLDVEQFIFADQTQDLHWMRTAFRASRAGFCIDLDTVSEGKELEFDLDTITEDDDLEYSLDLDEEGVASI